MIPSPQTVAGQRTLKLLRRGVTLTLTQINGPMNFVNNKLHASLFSLIPGAWFILFLCSTVSGDNTSLNTLPQLSEHNSSASIVKFCDLDNSTIYSISSQGCTIEWIARNSEIGVIKCQTRCALPLSQQLPLLTLICNEFFSKDKNALAFRTLFWGRLAPDRSTPATHELSLRLALAAHKSLGWDAKRGRPKNGDINRFVRDLANREKIYPELRALFENFHRSITFSSAEKVLVLEAGKLPFFDQLNHYGIKASDRLPYDCLTWFSVSGQ
jgi:hypothetical protein